MVKIRGMSNAETPFTKLGNNWNISLEAVVDKGFNITPQHQRFELLLWCSVIKPELTLFQNQWERIRVNTIIYREHSFSLIPKRWPDRGHHESNQRDPRVGTLSLPGIIFLGKGRPTRCSRDTAMVPCSGSHSPTRTPSPSSPQGGYPDAAQRPE